MVSLVSMVSMAGMPSWSSSSGVARQGDAEPVLGVGVVLVKGVDDQQPGQVVTVDQPGVEDHC